MTRRSVAPAAFVTLLVVAVGCGSAGEQGSSSTRGTAASTTVAEAAGPIQVTEQDLSVAEELFAPIDAEVGAFRDLLATGAEDDDAIRAFVEEHYSVDIVFNDPTFGDYEEGRDGVLELYQTALSYFAGAVIEDSPTLVGDPSALAIVPFRDLTLGSDEFTAAEPLIEVDLIEIDNQQVGSILLFWDLHSLGRIFGDLPLFDGVVQHEYATAWSSGDTDEVAALYGDDAVRHDGLANVDAVGTQAIAAEAEHWFDELPGAVWTIQLPFGERFGKQAGAVFEVTHNQCLVTIGIVFDLDGDGLISRELVHYDADDLRACGWVQ